MIGAPDGVSAVFLPPLLARCARSAPGIDIVVRHMQRETFAAPTLDAQGDRHRGRTVRRDFRRGSPRALYEEDFVVAARIGHPFLKTPTLERYCAAAHLLVSLRAAIRAASSTTRSRERGLSRRVAVAVPNFMMALDLVGRPI